MSLTSGIKDFSFFITLAHHLIFPSPTLLSPLSESFTSVSLIGNSSLCTSHPSLLSVLLILCYHVVAVASFAADSQFLAVIVYFHFSPLLLFISPARTRSPMDQHSCQKPRGFQRHVHATDIPVDHSWSALMLICCAHLYNTSGQGVSSEESKATKLDNLFRDCS